ncbi:MAG TPA: tRNA (adenine(22)-N(1))-methyltransferase TrmK [Atopostipes sp.]|nr:tRNA (adenine(22)-N(1))-methyltransferase TrmK [Atopostipes sp.]
MEKINLSKRLKKAAEFVKKGEPVADIGSDHAYLPIYLVQNSIIPKAIVGEIVKGPYENAQKTVATYYLEDKISIRLGDGLKILRPEDHLGSITICGMGGVLIAGILEEGLEKNLIADEVRLVLQPNNGEKQLRQLLQANHYRIIAESILKEKKKIYELIVAEKSHEKVTYTDDELTFGPFLIKEKSPIFYEKWESELAKNQYILSQLEQTDDKDKMKLIQEKIHQIKKVLL